MAEGHSLGTVVAIKGSSGISDFLPRAANSRAHGVTGWMQVVILRTSFIELIVRTWQPGNGWAERGLQVRRAFDEHVPVCFPQPFQPLLEEAGVM